MRAAEASTGHNLFRFRIMIVGLCTVLFVLAPLSASAQAEAQAVAFWNVTTDETFVVTIQPRESSDQIDFAMRAYENENLVEDLLGEGFQVLDSDPLSRSDTAEFGVKTGFELDVTLVGCTSCL